MLHDIRVKGVRGVRSWPPPRSGHGRRHRYGHHQKHVVMVTPCVFAFIGREARRVVQQSSKSFRGVRPERRDHLPNTTFFLFNAVLSVTLLKHVRRVFDQIHDLVPPTTLTSV